MRSRLTLLIAAAFVGVLAGPQTQTFHNGHHAGIGAYLANALVPSSDRMAISAQDRDVNQRQLTMPTSYTRIRPCLGLAGTSA